jgi:anti-anti-sigma factor
VTTVADSTRRRTQQTPLVEVIVGQELEGMGLQRLRLLLDDALTLHPAELVVDLAGSRRLDVAALHVLLDAHARALRAGGLLSLRSVSDAHARSIALAGLRSVFHIVARPELPEQAGPQGAGTPAVGPLVGVAAAP